MATKKSACDKLLDFILKLICFAAVAVAIGIVVISWMFYSIISYGLIGYCITIICLISCIAVSNSKKENKSQLVVWFQIIPAVYCLFVTNITKWINNFLMLQWNVNTFF
eukprot:155843_1